MRLHYVYPYPHVDALIPMMAEGKLLPYIDMPLQHGAQSVLQRMKRPAATEKTLDRIARWRDLCPDLTIRSTFIVGYPGETRQSLRRSSSLSTPHSSIASAASNTQLSKAPQRTNYPIRCLRRSKRIAGSSSWRSSSLSALKSCSAKWYDATDSDRHGIGRGINGSDAS